MNEASPFILERDPVIENPNSLMLGTGYCRNFIGMVIALAS